MGDRPERQPVWVYGGPAHYYQNRNASSEGRSGILGEMRRGSTGSVTSPGGSLADGTISPPSSPSSSSPIGTAAFSGFIPSSAAAVSSERRQSSTAQSQVPRRQSQSGSQYASGSPPGMSGWAGPGSSASGKSPSLSGVRQYSGLNTQKRGSSDEAMTSRRQSWKEMEAGSDPAGHRFWKKWWDGFTRG